MKRNGEFHRPCEPHHTMANVNQRRLKQRRRMRNKEELLIWEGVFLFPGVGRSDTEGIPTSKISSTGTS
ncbi:hypothetical protein PC118_g14221 [Phytophthora cactorum]|uniref:Uncharacterized protein n=1 Tax=Phytophthora cactorum TaxID=29920 RepID=A0A8T1BJJ7_9STRA|nr:hypothetical protein PC111_g8789 [Phytophthora cactorum]KAG2904963.1 hypothetical protein PC115_g14787 [Phytophthora cactorum]KAG2907895.1 hypothetical protein PC114_g10707 [Phytophthora cactorum]KAG2940419.1 hypothetical protein PC117_g10537 [Phytophthora cactorum]KAG2974987.1 hypothetical protein PC118_g14221 [Phytophthora cactorum]